MDLKKVALAEMSGDADKNTAKCVAIADQWWEYANKLKGDQKTKALLRARNWYLLGRGSPTDNANKQIQKRLDTIPLSPDRIRIFNTPNVGYNDRGTIRASVVLYSKGKSIWSETIELPWNQAGAAGLDLFPPDKPADMIQVNILSWRMLGGGLAEVEAYQDGQNIAKHCPVACSSYYRMFPEYHPSKINDGNFTGKEKEWILDDKTKGWIKIFFTQNMPRQK